MTRYEKLQERLAKLAGGVAVIRVGGATEVEVKEKKDRVEDALNATRAAVEEGVLPGGGVPLLRAIRALENLKIENPDQKTGIDIVRKAIQTPARQIVDNSGDDGAVVVGKLIENASYAYGCNAQTGEYGDLVKLGIIDPTKVVRTALQDAASVAGLLITTEAIVVEAPKKEAPALSAGRRHGLLKNSVRSKKQRRGPGVSLGPFSCPLVTHTVQIKCINRTETMSPHERITHVGGYVSSQWKITLNDAIGKIESGETFFVQALRRTVGVIVALSPFGKKYLKTEADGDQPDTLLRLPECP